MKVEAKNRVGAAMLFFPVFALVVYAFFIYPAPMLSALVAVAWVSTAFYLITRE